jgi:uncharacterized membrane protein YfhO
MLVYVLSNALEKFKMTRKLLVEKKYYKYILYTIAYWILAGCILIRLAKGGYVAIGTSDPIAQHYPIMIYIGRLLKNIVNSVINHQQFVFPMVDWTVGMGENTIASLNYYGLGDIFYLLTVFVSESQMPYFYSFLFYFRVFLGGIAFIAMCNEICPGKSHFAYVIGGLAYSLSGFALASNMHIIFVHAMMYIPLMMLGAERTLNGKRRFLLTLTVCFFAMTGFYYLYIGTIAMAIYVIYRSIEKRKQRFLSLILEYVLGLGLASFILIPQIIGVFNSSRIGRNSVPIFMTFRGIISVLENIHIPYGEAVLSVSPICIISILWILTSKGKRGQKINIVLCLLSVVMPIISLVMSGFSVVYDRWELVVILYFAYLVVTVWDDLIDLNIWQKLITTSAFVMLLLYGKRKELFNDKSFKYVLIFYLVMVMAVWLIPLVVGNICKTVLAVIVVAMICRDWNCVARDISIDNVTERNVVSELIDDDGFYRVEYEKTFAEPRYGMNLSLRFGFNGISEYTSIESQKYINAFEIWVASGASTNNGGLDQRTILETLAGVKYYIGRKENTMIVPYGFEKQCETSDGEWILYENQYSIPIVYFYNCVYNEEKIENLNVFDRQEIMMQAAIISDYSGTIGEIISFINDNSEAEWDIIEQDGVVIDDGVINTQNGSTIKVEVSYVADSEYYLMFDEDVSVTVDLPDGYEKYRVPMTIGNADDESGIITITFNGEYSFNIDDMHIIQHSFQNYESELEDLTDGVASYEVGTNRIDCNVDIDNDEILCVAVPYIDGWKAYIDGEETEIVTVNSLYMGIDVPEGQHDIVFIYVTPGLKVGAFISSGTLLLLVIYALLYRKKH